MCFCLLRIFQSPCSLSRLHPATTWPNKSSNSSTAWPKVRTAFVLYYTPLYKIIPFHPYHTIQAMPCHIIYHTIPYHTILYHATPYHTIPYHTIPYHTIPYHTIPYPAVALTQISAYSTHKNLAVRKIIEAMRTAYAKKRDSVSRHPKQNMTQTITEHTRVCEKKARIVCEEHFISLNLNGAFEMRHSFLYWLFFGTHFRIFVRKFLVHLRTASPQKLARPLHTIPYHTTLCHTIPHHTIPYYAVLTMLHAEPR